MLAIRCHDHPRLLAWGFVRVFRYSTEDYHRKIECGTQVGPPHAAFVLVCTAHRPSTRLRTPEPASHASPPIPPSHYGCVYTETFHSDPPSLGLEIQRCTGGKFGFFMFHASDRVLKDLRGEIREKQEK